GLPRGAVGLRGGAAEIVGVGGDVAEAAHTGRRRPVVGTTAGWRSGAVAAGRQRRWSILRVDRRRARRLRTRRWRWGRRRIATRISSRTLGLPQRGAVGAGRRGR